MRAEGRWGDIRGAYGGRAGAGEVRGHCPLRRKSRSSTASTLSVLDRGPWLHLASRGDPCAAERTGVSGDCGHTNDARGIEHGTHGIRAESPEIGDRIPAAFTLQRESHGLRAGHRPQGKPWRNTEA